MMNYQEFMNIVPKETADFVNMFLKLYDEYVYANDKNIIIDDENIIENLPSKIFCLLIFTKFKFDINDATRVFLEQNKIRKIKELDKIKEYNYDNYEIFEEEIFNRVSQFLCCYKFVENYIFLSPEAIIRKYYEKYCNNSSFIYDVKKLFEPSINISNVFSDFIDVVNNLGEKKKKNLEIDFYKDFSYELISYLESASSIFKYFENKGVNNSKVVSTIDDMVIASLLVSIKMSKHKISVFFDDIGLTKKNMGKVLNIDCDERFEFPVLPAATIMYYFRKYLEEGKNKDVCKKDLTIEKIISNILDRDFTKSMVLETLLFENGLSLDIFDKFDERINNFEKKYLMNQKQKKINKFYGGVSKEVIEFVDFVSKVHIIIKKSMDEEICNRKYIYDEKDVRCFAFFISSYFFENNFITYFKENGISYEKVMNFLNLDIKKADIEKIQSDIDLIIEQYVNIIFRVTSDKQRVSINTVMGGIGNINYCDSKCIQNLLKDINSDLRISDNLNSLIDDYNTNKEAQRKYKLEQKFFGDMPKQTVEFIEKASKVYQSILKNSEPGQFNYDDIVELSIYFTSILYYKGHEIDFLKSLIDVNKLNDFLPFSSDSPRNYDKNIDIIYKYFGKYVFGFKNKDKNKIDITVKDIYTNIFNKNINDSLSLYKFLDDFGFKITEYDNFDESEDKFIEEKIKNVIIDDSINYFENLSKVYDNLCDLYDANMINDKINILDAAKLLSIFLERNNSLNVNSEVKVRLSLLEKRGINLNSYLNYLNISEDDFSKYENKEVNYKIICENFFDICSICLEQLIIDIFIDNNSRYKFEDYIISLEQFPEVIYEEMYSGIEAVVPLSKDEQLEHFNNLPISKLDYNITTIASFGRELSEHSLIIADEYLKIAEMDSNENDVIYDIQEELDKLSPKNEVKLFFRKKISAVQKIEQNKIILSDLNKFLEQKENNIYEQIEHFEYLKKLIAVYVYRLNGYITELENTIKNFEKNDFNEEKNLKNFDIEIVKQIFNDKLLDFKKSLLISTQQYQKINLLLGTHALTLSKISTYRNTIIPNLYMEISIRDGIISEKESIESLNKLNDLLDNMISTNNQLLDRNVFQNKILSNNSNIEIDFQLGESVKNILIGENLVSEDELKNKNLENSLSVDENNVINNKRYIKRL